MKALGLLLLRCALAVLVAVWAAALVASPEGGIAPLGVWVPSLAIDPLSVQLAGGLGAVLALLVLLGFFRIAAYPLLLVSFAVAAVAAWPFPAAPLDLVAGGVSTFLLLAVLAIASLMPLVFYGEDRFAFDRLPARRPAVVAAASVASAPEASAPSTEEMASAGPVAAAEPAAEAAPEAAPVCEVPAAEPADPSEAVAEVPAEEPQQALAEEAPAAEPAEPEKSAA